jgi:serine/threonine-protein kinase RsbW
MTRRSLMHWFDKLDHTRKPLVDLHANANARHREVRRPDEVAGVLENLGTWMKVQAYPRRDLFAVTLALHEAVINALRHGNCDDPGKRVRIDYLVEADEVLVRVEDEGLGFDPASLPDPHRPEALNQPDGRGLLLIRAYSTWVSVDPPGNRVTFARRRSAL